LDMKLATFAFCVCAAQASAGGLDATGQPISFLFGQGTVAELGFGIVGTEISGRDAAVFGGSATGNLGRDIAIMSFSYKQDLTDRLSFGVLVENPFVAEIAYGPGSVAFAGTSASAKTTGVTLLGRYKVTDRISVFGGPRFQSATADFLLTGAIYGPFSGYSAEMERDSGLGYVVGAAFEIPEYFLRASLTYGSAISHDFETTEISVLGTTASQVSADTPQSVNFEFQTGVAPGTFAFGGARWVEWSALQFAPPVLSAVSPDPLVDFRDTWSYTLGIGRQFSDHWSGTLAVVYEPSTNKRPTPLSPTDGYRGLALGAIYRTDRIEMHLNMAMLRLGDTQPYVNALGTTVSTFEDNRSFALGSKLVFRF
jgi:long-chain fatty acid transport protein